MIQRPLQTYSCEIGLALASWQHGAIRHIEDMRILQTLCFALGLVGLAHIGNADQTDPRLESLFEELKTAAEPAAAAPIEQQIWGIWLEPSDPAVQPLLETGMAAMSLGDHRAALEAFDQVVAMAPGFAEGWNKRATVHYLLNNLEESLADIDETLALEPRHFGALSGRGLVYVKLREPEQALAAFEEALEVSPQMIGPRANAEALRELLGQRDI